MKKLFAILLCFVMVLGMSFTALAASSSEDAGNFTVTIENVIKGEVYNVYKIFDVTYSGENSDPESASQHLHYAYSITKSSQWWQVVTEQVSTTTEATIEVNGLKFTKSADNENIYIVEKTDDFDPEEFAVLLGKNAESMRADKSGTATDEDQLVFEGLDAGYYFATTTTGSLFTLNTTEPEAVLEEKNDTPTFDKKVKKESEDDSKYGVETNQTIGKTVNFKIEITDGTGTNKEITLHDKMSDGLTLTRTTDDVDLTKDTTFEITVNNVPVEADNYDIEYDAADGCTFEIVFHEDYVADLDEGAVIVIKYDAVVNENAKISKDTNAPDYNPNKAHIDYSNQSYVDQEVKVYTYKADVVKFDDNTGSEKTVLDGAEFKLYGSETGDDVIKVKKSSDGVYRVVDTTTDTTTDVTITTKNGEFKIEGLGNGTYYLEETKAPDGYNKLAKRQAFTINGANLDATVTDQKYVDGGVGVGNKSGSEIPSTGGIGTTIFYIAGGVLVLGAAVVLIAKKRMKADEA